MHRQEQNLNEIIPSNDGDSREAFLFSTANSSGTMEVYFEDIEDVIISKINKYSVIFGCVAWLTSEKILKALANKRCLIIVQEEDFLRPDTNFSGEKNKWKEHLLGLYSELDGSHFYLGGLGISQYNIEVPSGIRRLGYINKYKVAAFPRMHNKFIIGLNYIEGDPDEICEYYDACEVITGSYNYTENSRQSLENIVCIKDSQIVSAYEK
jgi:hypothetical protein